MKDESLNLYDKVFQLDIIDLNINESFLFPFDINRDDACNKYKFWRDRFKDLNTYNLPIELIIEPFY